MSKAQVEFFGEQRRAAEMRIDELEAMLKAGERQYNDIVTHAVALDGDLKAMRNEAVKNQRGYIDMESLLLAARRDLGDAQSRCTKLAAEAESTRGDHGVLQQRFASLDAELRSARVDHGAVMSQHQRELDDLRRQLNNANENYQQLRHGAVNLDADCQRLRHERDQLRHQLSTIPVPTAPGSELPGQNAQVQEECARLRREVAELSANASTELGRGRACYP